MRKIKKACALNSDLSCWKRFVEVYCTKTTSQQHKHISKQIEKTADSIQSFKLLVRFITESVCWVIFCFKTVHSITRPTIKLQKVCLNTSSLTWPRFILTFWLYLYHFHILFQNKIPTTIRFCPSSFEKLQVVLL